VRFGYNYAYHIVRPIQASHDRNWVGDIGAPEISREAPTPIVFWMPPGIQTFRDVSE
jgi:hypothetical protein